jgi:hypothetical protein
MEALTTEQLERLHAALMALSSMDPHDVRAYVLSCIAQSS